MKKTTTPAVRIAVAAEGRDSHHLKYTEQLSSKLGLPLIDLNHASLQDYDLLLVATGKRLELRETHQKSAGPVYVDFISGPTAYRRISGVSRRQPIARAVGLRSGLSHVVDATAGLGRDSFLLACLGCTVTAIERSAVLVALLHDGMERVRKRNTCDHTLLRVMERITLIESDACEVLKKLTSEPDVVYLDPMYPNRRTSAKVKKEMRICRKLVGDDQDIDQLMTVAMDTARKRVVVKRHTHTPPLLANPSLCFSGRKVRYDVYLRHP